MTMLAVGCSAPADLPKLAEVSGEIMMDGDPLPGVNVIFESPSGVVSYGATDAGGRYELTYRGPYKGAGIGENTVRIETALEAPSPGRWRDPVHFLYNAKSILTAEVTEGSNNFDFALESKPKKD